MPDWAFFIISGGDEGIRTLDTVAGILHFQCSALDQLCDVSGFFILRRFLLIHQLVHLPMRFPILHQFHAAMGLRW